MLSREEEHNQGLRPVGTRRSGDHPAAALDGPLGATTLLSGLQVLECGLGLVLR